MAKSKLLTKNFFVIIISLLFVLLFVFLVIDGYFDFMSHERIHVSAEKDMINQRMRSLLFEMNIFPHYIGDNLLFLSRLSSLRGMIDTQDYGRTMDVQRDFLDFMMGSTSYYQLRYLNETGYEVVRINFANGEYELVSEDELQDKSYRYYFTESMKLSEGEIYLSDLDLNVEYKEIENRGTELDPIYVPALRIATPVFRNNGSRAGVVMLNLYADYFLDDIRRAQRDGEEVFLIDKKGYYLSHPEKEKEFSFMFGDKDYNFFKEYSYVPKGKVLGSSDRIFETEDKIFSFEQVHPTVGDVGLINNSAMLREDYYWVLISVSDKEILSHSIDNLKEDYFNFLFFSGILIVIMIGLIFLFTFKFTFCRRANRCD